MIHWTEVIHETNFVSGLKCKATHQKGMYLLVGGIWLRFDLQKQPTVFYKKDVPKNFAKFTGKHLCKSFFLNKIASCVL